MKRYLPAILFIYLFILSGCGTPANKPFEARIDEKLDKFMMRTMKEFKAPGMILGVWVPGKGEYLKAKGKADIAKGIPMRPDKIFRIGSLTKTYTGTVILQLVDEGKLKLDDTLDKYFSWVPDAKNITIRQLLNMTSGLYNYSETEEFGKLFEADRMRQFKPADLVRMAIKQKPYFAPGKGYHYSNTNTVILGMIVNKVTNSSLEDEVKRRIIEKLSLKHTYFPRNQKMPELDYIHGYMVVDKKYQDWSIQNLSWGWAAGAIISNVPDLRTYIQALGDGTFLSKKLQTERFSGGYPLPKEQMVKLGYTTLRYCMAGFKAGDFVGHNGGLPGYVDIAMYNPKDKAVIVIMLNIQPEGDATLKMLKEVHAIIYPDKEI